MGGRGSGRYDGFDGKRTAETSSALSIAYLKKHGLLKPGSISSIRWYRGSDKENGSSIGIVTQLDRITLLYKHRSYRGEWEPVKQMVPLTYTRCHLGGRRAWFM